MMANNFSVDENYKPTSPRNLTSPKNNTKKITPFYKLTEKH